MAELGYRVPLLTHRAVSLCERVTVTIKVLVAKKRFQKTGGFKSKASRIFGKGGLVTNNTDSHNFM